MLFQHLVAEDLLFQRVEILLVFGLLFVFYAFHQRSLQIVNTAIAFELPVLLRIECVRQIGAKFGRDLIEELLVDRRGRVLALRLARLAHQVADAIDDLVAALMAKLNGLYNVRFADACSAGFHHHYAAFRTGDNDVEHRFTSFLVSRIRMSSPFTIPTRTAPST